MACFDKPITGTSAEASRLAASAARCTCTPAAANTYCAMSPIGTASSSASAGLLRGVLRSDVPMAAHVSWRCGGRARRTYAPADLADLCDFLRTLPSREPLCFVGLGSNLLVRDGGWAGTVILMHRPSAEIRLEGEQFWADAGAACPKLARHAARECFEGAEFLAGVPGTLGGAVAMNAGTALGELEAVLVAVEGLLGGELVRLGRHEECCHDGSGNRDSRTRTASTRLLRGCQGKGKLPLKQDHRQCQGPLEAFDRNAGFSLLELGLAQGTEFRQHLFDFRLGRTHVPVPAA